MLRRELIASGLDAYLVIKNTRYFAGTSAGEAVIVPSEGEPILLCKRLELERARRESDIRKIYAYFPSRVPLQRGERVFFGELWQLIVERLKEMDALVVGFDGMSSEVLRDAYEVNYRERPELVLGLCMVKSRQELNWLHKASWLATRGMLCASELVQAGRTELEIAAEAEYAMRKAGSDGTPFSTIIASGRNSWLPHATATSKRLQRGELVVVDLGATYKGYASDMTRTFALEPKRKQSKLLEVVKRAQLAAFRRIRDGVRAASVDEAAREVISHAGYARFCTHGTGHGIGLDVHEPPSLEPGSKDTLREGMIVTVEPGIYVPKIGGARREDMVLVTKEGFELFTE